MFFGDARFFPIWAHPHDVGNVDASMNVFKEQTVWWWSSFLSHPRTLPVFLHSRATASTASSGLVSAFLVHDTGDDNSSNEEDAPQTQVH